MLGKGLFAESKHFTQVRRLRQANTQSIQPFRKTDVLHRRPRKIEEVIQECVHKKKPVSLERMNPREMKRRNFARQTVRAAARGMPDDFVKQVVEHSRISCTVRFHEVLYYGDPAPHYFGVPWRVAVKHKTVDAI